MAQVLRLANVDDLARLVFVNVDAGRDGQILEFLFESQRIYDRFCGFAFLFYRITWQHRNSPVYVRRVTIKPLQDMSLVVESFGH